MKARERFATTRWSLVLAAGDRSPGAERALAELCAQYWYPLYAYVRRRGHDAEDARDLTQAFFAKLLEKHDLAKADRSRGRFRTFLLSSMKNFLAGEWRKQKAQKRGGDVETLGFDFDSAEDAYQLEPAHAENPEALYHRRWALELLDRALLDLETHYRETGRAELFEALKGCVGGEHALPGPSPYAALAPGLGMSPGALRTAASRLRSRWRKRLRELVAETVGEASDVTDELQYLIAALG